MSKYHLVPFSLGITQIAKVKRALKNNETIKLRLSAKSIGKGTHKLALTDTQYKKVAKKKKEGVGCELTLTSKALRHTAKSGGGFLSGLAGTAIKGLSNYIGDEVSGMGVRKAKKRKVAKKRGKGFLSGLAGSAIKGLGSYIGDKVSGMGFRSHTKVNGGGFLPPGVYQ